ncbi:MAG: hypothetical protein Q9163_003842 [Psora crenata]
MGDGRSAGQQIHTAYSTTTELNSWFGIHTLPSKLYASTNAVLHPIASMSLHPSPGRKSSRLDSAARSKAVERGSPLGVYDRSSVRDRVRQWQAQGGGVIEAGDQGHEEVDAKEAPRKCGNSKKCSPKTPSTKHPSQDMDISAPKSGPGDSAFKSRGKGTVKRPQSAPAKRVVSDSHWRRKKGLPKSSLSAKTSEDGSLPSSVLPNKVTLVEPMAEPKPERKRGRNERKTLEKQDVGNDAGIRVHVTPSDSRRRLAHQRRQRSISPGIYSAKKCDKDSTSSRSLDTSEPKRNSPHYDKPLRDKSSVVKGNDRRRRRSSSPRQEGVENSLQLGGSIRGMGNIPPQRGNILTQVFGDSRKRSARQTPEPSPANRVPSIEAWLDDTPDPFLDEQEPAAQRVDPFKPSSRISRVTEHDAIVEDPNRIWDSLDTKEGTRRVISGSSKKKRIPSSAIYYDNPFPSDFDAGVGLSQLGDDTTRASKFVDLKQEPTDKLPSALKRRAARKSASSPFRERRKSRIQVDPLKEGDVTSDRSSDITKSSFEELEPQSSLKPARLNVKRPFPSTGQHRLSTIASVETFNGPPDIAAAPSRAGASGKTVHSAAIQDKRCREEARDHFDPDSFKRTNSRLTKHADLISVLSLPRAGSKSIRSARSIRTNRARLGTATLDDLMDELSTDEGKYMRELRTLVDGVIPVLLTCVLSKSDSAVAAGLFRSSPSAGADPNFTRPIVDMGIALERMKTLHKRIPLKDPCALLTWAHGAQRVYVDYLKAWRMGFQDVVVNLATTVDGAVSGTNVPVLEEGLPRDQNGDVINGDGEKVDVAFLLKRPLVRLKYLAKTLKGINFVRPSAECEGLAAAYQDLVGRARLRVDEERARLEDEAAANIDPTRARDPCTLAPLSGVMIDGTRRVRARDHFNLALQHSSGQFVDCCVEFLLRDDAINGGNGGDLLICEVDGSGRWLLFPPIPKSLVSARNGDKEGELVVMVRGLSSDGNEWHETFSIRGDDEQAGFEWVHMLGLEPVPPSPEKSHIFLNTSPKYTSPLICPADDPTISGTSVPAYKSKRPSPGEVDVPIGEQAKDTSEQQAEWPTSSHSSLPTTVAKASKPQDVSPGVSSQSTTDYVAQVSHLRWYPGETRAREMRPSEPTSLPPRSFKEALGLSGTSAMSGLRRAKANKRTSNPNSSSSNGHQHPRNTTKPAEQGTLEHGPADRRESALPSMELPYIPKIRKSSPPVTPIIEPLEEPVWPAPLESRDGDTPTELVEKRPTPAKAGVQRRGSPPFTPPHKYTNPIRNESPKTPVIGQSRPRVRRSSSPLKHEYEPSTVSESSSASGASTVEHKEIESMTDSSTDEDLEAGDVPTPLMSIEALRRVSEPLTKPASLATPDGTLKPSDSASQSPYKTVPSQPKKAAKTIASIFSWSETGTWQSLHPDECSIVVTPGLIEAFKMSAAHSSGKRPSAIEVTLDGGKSADDASNTTSQNDEVQGERPLVALELTPLVPLRRGTAIDISIRSPPTPNSQINSGNNIMFRSRSPEECEALYALINHSRIHNPTYVALQNARGPFTGNSFGGALGRRPSGRGNKSRSSWFSGIGRSSSYRASSARTPSIAPSESSVGSMSSAFSALKRFGRGGGGGIFNIALSTITSRNGTGSGANSVYTSSDNSSGSGTPLPALSGMVANPDGSLGLKGAKIRLYIRETASRWRDMGSARLTIMGVEGSPMVPDIRAIATGCNHQSMHEKRIVVNGKTKGEVLLDVQLGESCFERVARTGIAVSVWEDVVGPNGEVGVVGAVGGVAGGRTKVYMIQVCATFQSLCAEVVPDILL